METGLAIIPEINTLTFFQPGASKDILAKLEADVREQAAKLDISTKANRESIVRLSNLVCKTKTGLDAAGKDLVSDEKKRLKLIDEERSAVWDRLEALQKEVRKPVTDWEDADKKRVAGLEFKVLSMSELASIPYGATTADIESRLAEMNALVMTNMQEFTSRAELAEKQTREYLTKALAEAQKRDEEAAEMARLRAESLAREQKERDERIAQEAREKAQREAEAERKRIEEEKFAAEAKAKQAEASRIAAQEQAERDAKAAEERRQREAEEAEKRHQEAIAAAAKKAEDDRIAAEAKAKKDAELAVEAEKSRAAAEAKQIAEETALREKNKKHKASINNAAADALEATGLSKEDAVKVVTAIAQGKVPNVKISY
jgi:hypothetical protein